MSKAPSKVVQHTMAVLCLCSIVVYTGSQFVSETKASFSDHDNTSVSLTSAFVFPATIEKLLKDTQQLTGSMITEYSSVGNIVPNDLTLPQAEEKLKLVNAKWNTLTQGYVSLEKLRQEIDGYYQKAQTIEPTKVTPYDHFRQVVDYVNPAFSDFKTMFRDVNDKADMKKLFELKRALEKRIKDLKQKKPSPVQDGASDTSTSEAPQTSTSEGDAS